MKVKTSEATELQLDWLVAKCLGLQPIHHYTIQKGQHIVPHPYYEDYDFGFTPSEDWAQGGPIIERERIEFSILADKEGWVMAIGVSEDGNNIVSAEGPTYLVAAMRCFVASRLGNEVEIPEDLA